MADMNLRAAALRGVLALLLLIGMSVSAGCNTDEGADSGGTEAPAEESAPGEQEAEEYTSWTITIVDDDTYTEGDVTYSIALNLTATNASPSVAGTYTGSATAKTDTTGMVQGMPLNASAIAESSVLEFTLVDEADRDDGLAPLTDDPTYWGTGSIVMAAAGSGTVGPASGGFSNTSGQPVEVRVVGNAVTFRVEISGHTYTFEGMLQGQ